MMRVARKIANTFLLDPGRTIARRTVIVNVTAVLDPLPDVAVHIVKTKVIMGITADWLRIAANVV